MHERVVHSHRGELDSCHVCGQHFKGQSHESVLENSGCDELGTKKKTVSGIQIRWKPEPFRLILP